MITAILSLFCCFRLAKNWPGLIKTWGSIDAKFNATYGHPKFIKIKLWLVFGVYFFFNSGINRFIIKVSSVLVYNF